jgi:hypothetical protein
VALVIHSWTNDGKIRAIGRLPKNGRKCRSGVGAPGGDVVGVQLADYRRCRLWITCSDHHINPRHHCLGGKGSADLALSGVGRIAIVGLYRYVDDGEALEFPRQGGRQRVGGSSVVGQHA